jgi:ATP-dependent Clp protease adapter protein ClpS
MNSDTVDLSRKRFVVSIFEIRQEIVAAEEFAERYSKTVSLSDGSTRTVEVTPMMRKGNLVMELEDTGHRTYMGIIPVGTGTQTNGNLMVRIFDLDDADPARAEGRSRAPASPVLPPETSLVSNPDFVPPGFAHGIEILNDNTTPMSFVVAILSAHLGLGPEDSRDTMLAIHTRGGALIPTPSLADAQRIAAQITAEATESGYPLVCRSTSIAA